METNADPAQDRSGHTRPCGVHGAVGLRSARFPMLLPVSVIGSWSFPGWYAKFCEDVERQPEMFGTDDRQEAVRDAVRLAIDDQLRAGADIITDGEMQR